MKIRERIRRKLDNYKVSISNADPGLPFKHEGNKKVAVIGGGIAGLSAAANLAERGLSVKLFERENFLGGKVGSWTFESKGETLRTEHGFHAFFRQYFNLREFMKKSGSYKHLIPIDDYIILYDQNKKQGFKGLETTPGLNILALKKRGIFNTLTMINPLSITFLSLLQFDFDKTFKKYDQESFKRFAARTMMPKKMRLVFNSFSRAFFSEPEDMSMAELMKSFHFYFLSNDEGLVYDVLEDDFELSFISYFRKFIEQHEGEIETNAKVDKIEKTDDGFRVNGAHYDYIVLSTDVKASKKIIGNSDTLKQFPIAYEQLTSLKQAGYYAVYRIWTDSFEADNSLPFFLFVDRRKCLDSITLYHKMEKTSREWSEKHEGGIFELHSYILPAEMKDPAEIKKGLLDDFHHYFPELKNMEHIHEFFQLKNDFPGFHTGEYKNRPEIRTDIPGLYLAGDWVKMRNCGMLMEAAYTSGSLAANEILKDENLQENELHAVPMKGLLT